MKTFLLVLSLATAAVAKPTPIAQCPKSGLGFSVHFSQHPTVSKYPDTTAYGWVSKSSPRQSERVYVTSRRELEKLKAYAMQGMPKGSNVTEEKRFRFGKYEGLQLEGLSEQGVPFVFRLVPAQSHGYIYGSTNYDTAHNRDFVQSFAIVPK